MQEDLIQRAEEQRDAFRDLEYGETYIRPEHHELLQELIVEVKCLRARNEESRKTIALLCGHLSNKPLDNLKEI